MRERETSAVRLQKVLSCQMFWARTIERVNNYIGVNEDRLRAHKVKILWFRVIVITGQPVQGLP